VAPGDSPKLPRDPRTFLELSRALQSSPQSSRPLPGSPWHSPVFPGLLQILLDWKNQEKRNYQRKTKNRKKSENPKAGSIIPFQTVHDFGTSPCPVQPPV